MPDDKLPPVFIPITLELDGIGEPVAPVATPADEHFELDGDSPSSSVISASLAAQTREVLSTLTPNEERVLRMRFGIGEALDATAEEVDQDFEVTRQRIREIEAKALRSLRRRQEAQAGATDDPGDGGDDDR